MNLSKKTTLIIFDWDDTLFPTTYIRENNIDLTNLTQYTQVKNSFTFKQIDNYVHKLISSYMKHGTVVIVTNATKNWVQLSASVLSSVETLLSHIDVISAKSSHEKTSTNIYDWKKLSFKDVILSTQSKILYDNVISIGDANYEYYALVSLINHKNDCKMFLKSVKFTTAPKIDVFIEQLKLARFVAKKICTASNHVDLVCMVE